MPRQANKKPSIRITLTTTPQVQEYLLALVESGLYGGSVAEAAEILVCESLRQALKGNRVKALEQRAPQ